MNAILHVQSFVGVTKLWDRVLLFIPRRSLTKSLRFMLSIVTGLLTVQSQRETVAASSPSSPTGSLHWTTKLTWSRVILSQT